MRIAALQMDIAWEDRAANYEKVRRLAPACDLLVLPEMFATGFSMNPAFTAEPDDGPTTRFLRSLARERRAAVVGGLVLRGSDGRGRNVARLVDANGFVVATYAKAHLFSFADEHRHHEPGHGPVVFPLDEGEASAFVCYDLRFPEIFRGVAHQCWLMIVIASWPATRQRAWDVLLPARAVENLCFFLGVNRVGESGGLHYTGGTALYGPLGECLAHAGDGEAVLVADLGPDTVRDVRQRMPFLGDRRF